MILRNFNRRSKPLILKKILLKFFSGYAIIKIVCTFILLNYGYGPQGPARNRNRVFTLPPKARGFNLLKHNFPV